MDNIEDILEEHGMNKDNLEASLELARLFSQKTGLCCAELGRFTLACYQQLEVEGEE